LQVAALARAGVKVYFEDQRSGVVRRPELDRLLSFLSRGDELVVYKVDRVARSLEGLLQVVRQVDAAGAVFRSLTEPFDTGSLSGKLMLQMLGAFAEFERGMIRERCAAGRAAAVARGSRFGRKRRYDYEAMFAMREAGKSFNEIAASLGCARATAVKAVERVLSGRTPLSIGGPVRRIA
jgi:DNA invertase Pin-like site-specific DNA recombinase